MKTSLCVSAAVALLLGATVLRAQDPPAKEPTGAEKLWKAIHEKCCSGKDGKCEGDQKKACDNVQSTIAAGMGKCGEKFKKEGMKCEGCAKSKDGGPCAECRELLVKVIAPWLKGQASAKDATHTITEGEKKETVKCTLLAGPACKGCANEMSDAVVKACKEASKEKK